MLREPGMAAQDSTSLAEAARYGTFPREDKGLAVAAAFGHPDAAEAARAIRDGMTL